MPSELRLNSNYRRLTRLARKRRTSIAEVKAEEAAALAALQANPWIGARLAPALPADHPSIPAEEVEPA